jgi:hypothetical protein
MTDSLPPTILTKIYSYTPETEEVSTKIQEIRDENVFIVAVQYREVSY